MGKNCVICGAPSGIYPLCKHHLQMKANGEVEKCENCGTWYEVENGCPNCKETQNDELNMDWLENDEEKNNVCIICGEASNGYPQCRDCYYETRNYMDSLDKNSSVRKMRDYYYNLKERIVIINGLEEAQEQCKKLIAIAITEDNINDDSSLLDRVYNDVEILLTKKRATPTPENSKYAEERQEKDESKSRINTAQDGHNCESDMEVRIDDILYNSYILHCYGKSIDEITEKRKKCDWFIPIANGKGIYIEYWGMDTDKYKKDRQEKEELYKKYNIPYIGIEKDDPKQDTQTFKSNLIRDLTKLAIEKYGFMPEWKK